MNKEGRRILTLFEKVFFMYSVGIACSVPCNCKPKRVSATYGLLFRISTRTEISGGFSTQPIDLKEQ